MLARMHTWKRRLSFAMPRLSLTKLVKLLLLVMVVFVLHVLFQLLGLKTWPSVHPQANHDGVGGRGGDDRYINYLLEDDEASSRKLFSSAQVYPKLHGPTDDDRIVAQIQFVPKSVSRRKRKKKDEEQRQQWDVGRKVLLYYGRMEHPSGTTYFQEHPCAVRDCELTMDLSRVDEADVVIFSETNSGTDYIPRQPWQVWVMYLLESPEHMLSIGDDYNGDGNGRRGPINWTATYRHDSTLVTPYEKFVPINRSRVLRRTAERNYAAGKSKLVAWFVSNCYTPNRRLEYVQKLSHHIQVDIYGGCGDLQCSRSSETCSEMLNEEYKFYLAFENSNCRDYITEKFFVTGLQHDVIPVVMGAAPEDYVRAAPPHSFIHVDHFRSPRDLASFLLALDADDTMYNAYFRWKGLWKNIDTLFPCRLCALAHDVGHRGRSWYRHFDRWWKGPGVCIGANTWGRSEASERRRRRESEVEAIHVEKPERPPESVAAKDRRSRHRHRRRRRRDASKVESRHVKMKPDAPKPPKRRRRKSNP